eukprot:m.479660 g.479660  ORF g.479660 m.479660 type:complete len:509 (-) comp21551_c0_seq1:231-1757(-)
MAAFIARHNAFARGHTRRHTFSDRLTQRATEAARQVQRPFRESAHLIRTDLRRATLTLPAFRKLRKASRSVHEHEMASRTVVRSTFRRLEHRLYAPIQDRVDIFGEDFNDNWDADLAGLGETFGKGSLASRLHAEVEHTLTSRSLRRRIFQTFEDPKRSRFAWWLQLYILLLILLSSVSFTLDTVADLQDMDLWYNLEIFLVANFTLEYVIRFATCPDKWRFVWDFLNLIDLLAVLPFYLELLLSVAGQGIAPVRIVRLARGFRLLKLGRRSQLLAGFGNALLLTKEAVVLLCAVYVFITVLWASVLFYGETAKASIVNKEWIYDGSYVNTETGTNRTVFQSTVASLWWAIVTETGVGYGDMVPVTPVGKLIAGIVIAVSIISLALPITLLGENVRDEFRAILRTNKLVDGDVCLSGREPLLPSTERPSRASCQGDGPSTNELYGLYTDIKSMALTSVGDFEAAFEVTMDRTEDVHDAFDTLQHIVDEIRGHYGDLEWTDSDGSDWDD